jgi:hypothetical protein
MIVRLVAKQISGQTDLILTVQMLQNDEDIDEDDIILSTILRPLKKSGSTVSFK